MKICIVASAGGHLYELQSLLPIISNYDFFYVTFFLKNVTTELSQKTYFVINPDIRNPRLGLFAFLLNFFQSLLILLKERPNVIITSGATVAFIFCYLGKLLLRSKIIFIETMSRVNKPSLIGRLLYPIADLFLVQWKSLLKFYPKARYGGCLL